MSAEIEQALRTFLATNNRYNKHTVDRIEFKGLAVPEALVHFQSGPHRKIRFVYLDGEWASNYSLQKRLTE